MDGGGVRERAVAAASISGMPRGEVYAGALCAAGRLTQHRRELLLDASVQFAQLQVPVTVTALCLVRVPRQCED